MDNKNFYGEDDGLIYNPASRIPVCLCLDVSGSMSNCIGDLMEGVNTFYNVIRNDDMTAISCEIAIVTFSNGAKVIEDFTTIDKKKPVSLSAYGGTDMASGVEKALDLLEERKNDYKSNGVDYYQPWIVIMSDGAPNDLQSVKAVQERMKALENEKKLVVFSIGIGDDADMNVLNDFSRRGAKHLKGYNFKEFFEWLGKSTVVVSRSKVGDKVRLDVSTIDDWAEI